MYKQNVSGKRSTELSKKWMSDTKKDKQILHFFSFIRNHMGCELKHWTNVSSHMHHKKTNINNNNNECEREKNYHKCIHALKWKQSQMMNEMAEKKCTHWLFAPTSFCFDHKKNCYYDILIVCDDCFHSKSHHRHTKYFFLPRFVR